MVERADALQYEFDEGPCLTAWRERVPVRVDDTHTDGRWPAWTSTVRELGVRSVLSVPLVAAEDALGAIKVYSLHPGSYDQSSEQVLGMFAQQASVLLANTQNLVDARQLSAQLTQALASRDIIGAAKGILMAEGAADDEAAFAMLIAASKRMNVKLNEVARRIVAGVTARNAGRPAP
jgi:GAF domain-containing protein